MLVPPRPRPTIALVSREGIGLAIAVGVGLVLRIPTASSRAVLGFDDGTYLASVLAMREGGAPFREVFSSQGPVFLPLLRLADLAGAGAPWAVRMVPVLAGVGVVTAVWGIARRVGGPGDAPVAALLASTSGTLLFTTTRIGSDGVAAAFGSLAFLLAIAPGRRRATGAAVLIGLAIGAKSLMAAPALVAIVWLRWRREGTRGALTCLGIAGTTTLACTLPWGWSAVWDQSVAMHLDARTAQMSAASRWPFVQHQLWQLDRVLVVFLVLAVARALVRRTRGGRLIGTAADVDVALWAWAAAALLLVLQHRPLFVGHLTVLVPPMAILAARHRPPVIVSIVAAALLLPAHVAGAGWTLSPRHLTAAERAMVEVVSRIEPANGRVISDRQTLAWVAGRASPAWLVDPSFVRIRSGHLNTAEAVRAAHEPGTCAVMLWSGRLASLPGLVANLPDYRLAFDDGSHRLLLRDTCRLALRAGDPQAGS